MLWQIMRGCPMGRSIAESILVYDKPRSEIHETEIVAFIADLLTELAALAEHEIHDEEIRARLLALIASFEGGLICRKQKNLY